MTTPTPPALALTRPAIHILRILNIFYGFGVLLLLVASLLNAGLVFYALGIGRDLGQGLLLGLRSIMVIGIGGAVLVHVLLTHLLAIVDTVRDGDPFLARNAQRLQAIAWCVLAGELLRLAVGAIAAGITAVVPKFDVDAGFSFVPWLCVLLLFVLARVFDHGTRLRADLEGTV